MPSITIDSNIDTKTLDIVVNYGLEPQQTLMALGIAYEAVRFSKNMSDGSLTLNYATQESDLCLCVPSNIIAGAFEVTSVNGVTPATQSDLALKLWGAVSLIRNSMVIVPALSYYRSSVLDQDIETVYAGACYIHDIAFYNPNQLALGIGQPAFIKIYDKVISPTLGTDVPIRVIPVASGTSNYIKFETPIPISNRAYVVALSSGSNAATGSSSLPLDCFIEIGYKII